MCREVASSLASPILDGTEVDGFMSVPLAHNSHLMPSSFQNSPSFPTHHRTLSTSHKRSPSSLLKPISIPGSGSLPIPTHPQANGSHVPPSSISHRSMLGQSVDTSSASFVTADERPILIRSPSGRELGKSPAIFDSPIGMDDPAPVKRWYRQPGAGPYVNVAKERLLGLYISVFVYKGCEHLVEGVDKDFVTTGLAGGRFGNKGGLWVTQRRRD